MPRSAIEHVAVDHIAHPLELPALLQRLGANRLARRSYQTTRS
jgi:hypothetical protein